MEDQEQERERERERAKGSEADQRAEPVRSRWTPKPEQILILESIFNGGLVNPPKDETVRIRKLLEKFGPVGDANVFYWFQNRRSRSRRRQRQIQAGLGDPQQRGGGSAHYENVTAAGNFVSNPMSSNHYNVMNMTGGSSSSFGLDAATSDGLLSFSGHPFFGAPDTCNVPYHSAAAAASGGLITVFINGVATEAGRGALNVKAMFGGDYGLVHSSGAGIEVNHHGFVLHNQLQHGESYFLVPRNS